MIKLVTHNEEKLLARLDAEDKEQFEKYIDAQGEVNRLTATPNFLYGYKLGFIMTAEAFVSRNDLVVRKENLEYYNKTAHPCR